MALRTIVKKGDPILNKKCRVVTENNERLHTLIDDMKETLADADGAGLAAPQVGVMRRVCIVIGNDGEMIELVNPEIIESDGEQTGPEGCLSLPGRYGLVTRPNHVRVRANDRNGNVFEVEGIELTARCFCHEIEHLDGHLFDEHVDHFMTEEDFEETLEVVRKVRYDSAFTFIYSKRTGTPAAAMENQVPEEVVKERFDRLLAEVQAISAQVCGRDVHTVQEVLVEEPDSHVEGLVTGRMSNNTIVHFPGGKELIGKIVKVYLEESKGFYYMGSLVD